MTQINHGEGDIMPAEKVDSFAVIADHQGPKLVDPSETALTAKALFVDRGIEQTLASALGGFAVAGVLGDIRDDAMIKTDFAGRTGIKGTIGVEQRTNYRQAQAFHRFERGLKMGLQTKSVVMIAGHDACRGDNIALGIGDRQDIAGLGTLARLVSHAFTAFLD